ncbi:unnamed protein product [Rotaria sordida]|uniref:Envelope protein n=1 Tax=Rotaria sordida TaxID=392033 RepID=A0A819VGX0_9BILA|nr:unnamed protein product [Rotaria sordida]CAF1526942.1 unnamed protein product [Rotaria sordida]CAF3814124.1 unnamed protein product [Rotaria sordida]CAF4108560.1 unnamed protein product [Rotaria sordida]
MSNLTFFFYLIIICTTNLSYELNIVSNEKEGNISNEYNPTNVEIKNQCQNHMTYEQMKNLLERHPCIAIEIENSNMNNIKRRAKRLFNENTHNKINALYGKIDEHREMINYIFNNSINATILTSAIKNHHSNSPPQLNSWRDLLDLFLISILILCIIYYLIFKSGFKRCDRFLISLFKDVNHRVEQHNEHNQKEQFDKQIEEFKKQIQQLQNNDPIRIHTMYQNERNYPAMPSITNDIVRYNNGYISE